MFNRNGTNPNGAEDCPPFQLVQLQTNHSNNSTAVVSSRSIFIRTSGVEKLRKHVIAAATAVVLGIAATATGTSAFIGRAMAAETGTKTMPDSSINPQPTPSAVFDFDVRNRHHHWCYLPSSPCDNNHRDAN
jgi:hypothetical protein